MRNLKLYHCDAVVVGGSIMISIVNKYAKKLFI